MSVVCHVFHASSPATTEHIAAVALQILSGADRYCIDRLFPNGPGHLRPLAGDHVYLPAPPGTPGSLGHPTAGRYIITFVGEHPKFSKSRETYYRTVFRDARPEEVIDPRVKAVDRDDTVYIAESAPNLDGARMRFDGACCNAESLAYLLESATSDGVPGVYIAFRPQYYDRGFESEFVPADHFTDLFNAYLDGVYTSEAEMICVAY